MVYNQGGSQTDGDEDEVPEISQWESIMWLTILTLWISVLSEYLVDAIEVIFKHLIGNQFLGGPFLLLGERRIPPLKKKKVFFVFLIFSHILKDLCNL